MTKTTALNTSVALLRNLSLCFVALLAGRCVVADGNPVSPPSAPAQRSAAQLDQLVQPIAFYTDHLIGVILPASVYALEIGDAAFQLAQTNVVVDINAQSWDPSVKALAQFPSIVQRMDRNLPWTVELGRAFVAQQADVLDAIQRLRFRAHAAGTLKSDGVQTVTKATTTSGKEIITIAPVMMTASTSAPAAGRATTTAGSTPASPSSTPATTTAPSSYTPPPVYPPPTYSTATPSSASSAAQAVVGVAALAVVANNVDWDEKYVIDTPGGVVIVDEDDLEDLAEYRQSAQPHSTSTSTTAAQNRTATKAGATASTQPANRGTVSTQPTKSAWRPDASRMASAGAPQSAAATKSPASRGWSKPASTQSVWSSGAGGGSRAGGLSNLSEGSRARAYSGRGAASRGGGRFQGRSGK